MIDGMWLSHICHQITICVPTLRHQLEVSAEAQPVLVQRECLTQLVLHLLPGFNLCILPLECDSEPFKELSQRSDCLVRQFNLVGVCISSHSPPFKTTVARRCPVRERAYLDLCLYCSLCDLVTDRCTSINLLEKRVVRHAAFAHFACEAPCEITSVAMLRAALDELEMIKRHRVVVGRIETRLRWHEGHVGRVLRVLRGRDNELTVPIVKVENRWVVQSCENGLRRKLCRRLRHERWVLLRGGCVRYRRFLHDWICRGAA